MVHVARGLVPFAGSLRTGAELTVLDPDRSLPAVHVERPDGPWGTWIVRDSDGSGSVDVRFSPTVRSEMHVGPRRCLAEYYAPYGWFEGRIHTDTVDLVVDDMFGVGEQKLIRV